MFYPIAMFLALGLIGLAMLTQKKGWHSPTKPEPCPPEKKEPLPSHDDLYYHDESREKNNVKIDLPRCDDDICECGGHKFMNFGPDGAEH